MAPLTLILSLILAQASPLHATFPKAGRPAVSADLIRCPGTISASDFADRLVAEEGLSSWNGTGSAMPVADGLEAVAVYGGDGRRAMVMYRPAPAGAAGRVCRIRIGAGADKVSWNAATAWCEHGLANPKEKLG